jgi:hypothetical protein
VSGLVATLQIGERPPLGGGLRPAVVAHLYGGSLPRFVVHEVGDDGTMRRVEGAYAPEFDADPAYPVTDLLLATRREGSAAAQRLTVLSRKAAANYGRSFREMVFESAVARGAPGYGRLFEARSQLEAHPYEGVIAVTFLPGVDAVVRTSIADNVARIGPTDATLADGEPAGSGE